MEEKLSCENVDSALARPLRGGRGGRGGSFEPRRGRNVRAVRKTAGPAVFYYTFEILAIIQNESSVNL